MRRSLVLLALLLSLSSPVLGQLNRTAVSVSGSDLNSCAVNSPCRTFAAALAQTNSGGEMIVLESGGYGTVTVDKNVSIQAAPGVYAGITASTGTAVTITAGRSDIVVLRGLTINSLGAGVGIDITAAGKAHVEDCIVNGFADRGLRNQSAGDLFVNDSIFRNGGPGSIGLETFANSGTARASIDRCRFEANAIGIDVSSNGRAIVRDSVSVFNALDGFSAQPFFTTSELNVENCAAQGNGRAGIIAGGFSGGMGTIRVSNTMVTNNALV